MIALANRLGGDPRLPGMVGPVPGGDYALTKADPVGMPWSGRLYCGSAA